MKISIARNNDTGQILVRLEAETFAEILLLGRWTGHIEAAGQQANYTVVETNDLDGNQHTGHNGAVIVFLPIERRRPGAPDPFAQGTPSKGNPL
tara:strand:- start:8 stop:289 length:282 start_codon:yes stop_codon:yes gene_type:complete